MGLAYFLYRRDRIEDNQKHTQGTRLCDGIFTAEYENQEIDKLLKD